MGKLLKAIVVVGIGLTSGCGSGNAEKATEELIQIIDEASSTLEGVKNKNDAMAARPKLEEIASRLEAHKAKMDKIRITKSQEKQLEEKYKDKLRQCGERYGKAMLRLTFIEDVNNLLSDPMNKILSVLSKT